MWRKERLLIAVSFVCLVNGVLGRHYSSQRQDSNLEDPQSIRPTQIANGETFECVPADQQPAFQHPLLKDHTIQWQPTVLPREEKKRPKSLASKNTICPPYTIPIRRQTPQPKPVTPNNVQNSIYRFTRLELVHYPEDEFRGGHAFISVDGPNCESGQASGAAIWLESDATDQKSAIKAGWTVNPGVYGDSLPRLSIFWTGDNYHTTGCMDLLCPGFVQVDNDMMLGSRFNGISVLGGQQYEEFFYIFQDKATLDWWLICSQADVQQYVGYWPKEIVPGLIGGGTKLCFGGWTMADIGQTFPPMGIGQFPTGDRKYSNFFRQIHYVNISNYLITPYPYGANVEGNNPECYLLRYDDDGGDDMGHSIYLGGPGGASC